MQWVARTSERRKRRVSRLVGETNCTEKAGESEVLMQCRSLKRTGARCAGDPNVAYGDKARAKKV